MKLNEADYDSKVKRRRFLYWLVNSEAEDLV